MNYRRLGKSDLTVSVVGVGTWQFGGEWGIDYTQPDVDAIFEAAREEGINLIDTAECYGDHTSEAFIGEAIKKDREEWVVATKFGHKFNKMSTRDDIIDPQGVIKQLDDSLKALQTDYIDLYQFHSLDDDAFQTDRLWDVLAEEVEKGRIHHLGISIGNNGNIFQTSRASEVNAAAIQVVYNRIDQGPEKEVFPSCIDQDLGVLARVPLASGYLSGKYRPGATFDKSDVRGRWGVDARDGKLEKVDALRGEVPEGVPMAQWALAWCLSHDAVTSVIPGCKNPEQVRGNAAAAALDLACADHPQAVDIA